MAKNTKLKLWQHKRRWVFCKFTVYNLHAQSCKSFHRLAACCMQTFRLRSDGVENPQLVADRLRALLERMVILAAIGIEI